MIKILFVCLGNICRSPMAEGIMRQKVQQKKLERKISVSSAGTGSWHIGNPPDPRAIQTAAKHGLDIQHLRAVQVTLSHLKQNDWILALDRNNLRELESLADSKAEILPKIHLLRKFDPQAKDNMDVPDPYYGGDKGFERVYEIIDRSCDQILIKIIAQM